MSDVVVRPYEPQDEEGFYRVMSLTYNDGTAIEQERRTSRFADRFVAERKGEILGAFSVLAMTATRGAALLPCAGVAGVAVAPEARRGGVGRAMMTWALAHFRNHGVPLASLYAFREPYYARFGYGVAGRRYRISVPIHRLPLPEAQLPVRRLGPEDWAELDSCHRRFAHARSGVHVRSEIMWERVLNENRPLTVYAFGNPVEAYISISHRTAFWQEQWLSEFCWATPTGYESAVAFLHQIGINKTAVAWYEPSDGPYYARFQDAQVEIRLDRPVMFRVVDVPNALRALRPTHLGQFVMRLVDDTLPENEQTWRIVYEPNGVEVEPTQDAPDLAMDIRTFAPAFLGEPSLTECVAHGRVQVFRAEGLRAAEQLLPPSATINGDFF